MSTSPQTTQLVSGLVRLSKEFTSQEPVQASELKRAFKEQSKNDLSRTVVYLMEVVGVSDLRVKTLQEENKDLREILKLNNISLEDKDESASNTTEGNEGAGAGAPVGGGETVSTAGVSADAGADQTSA